MSDQLRPGGAGSVLAGLGAASLLALAVAFLMQYGFGFVPCSLCIWERWPYALVLPVVLLGFVTRRIRLALAVAALLLLGNAGLSLYHVGVEQGWFALPGGCVAGSTATTVEELRAQLSVAPPTCDQVSAAWLGLSLAAWNGIAALLLGLVAVLAASRRQGPGRINAATAGR